MPQYYVRVRTEEIYEVEISADNPIEASDKVSQQIMRDEVQSTDCEVVSSDVSKVQDF